MFNANMLPELNSIHLRCLKEYKYEKAELMAKVRNLPWWTVIDPEDRWGAKVIAIYKKDTRDNPGNYRLVSLRSIPAL